jgi:hypothetical protein
MRPYLPGEDFFNLIETAIPEFARAEYPVLLDFIKLFLTYLEQERTFTEKSVASEYGTLVNNQVLVTDTLGGTSYEIRKFLEYRDVDSTLDELVPHFLQMYAKNFPQRTFIDPGQFVATLRYLYTHKTVEDTIHWFFRVLFNEPAQLYYPRVDILKASDGTWLEEISIKVTAPTNGYENTEVHHYLGQQVKTLTGMAQVDRIRTTVVGQAYGQYLYVNELILKRSSIVGTFAPGQDVWNLDSEPVVHTTIIPVIVGVTVLSGGEDYVIGDPVTFSEGPGMGEGFGAAGIVTSVSKAPISGVRVNDGGDGYVIGDPVMFISSSGDGAEGYVDSVITGNILLEGANGDILLSEQQSAVERTYFALEDRDYIPMDLSIALFLSANVQFDANDYSAANQATWNANTTLDYVFASIGSVPFMHPWCYGDLSGNTSNVTLANTMLVIDMVSQGVHIANDAWIYGISSPTDANTTLVTSTAIGHVILSDTGEGHNRDRTYVTNTTLEVTTFSAGQTVKAANSFTTGLGDVTCNTLSSNVVGSGTNFTTVLRPYSHVAIGANQYVVKSITNSTFLTLWTRPAANATASAWSIVPTGTVREVTDQAQRTYGRIRHVKLVSPGSGYVTPPTVTVDSVSARAQALYHYDP